MTDKTTDGFFVGPPRNNREELDKIERDELILGNGYGRIMPDGSIQHIPAEQVVVYTRRVQGDSVTQERTYPGTGGARHVLRIGHHAPCLGGPSCKCLPLRSSDIHFPRQTIPPDTTIVGVGRIEPDGQVTPRPLLKREHCGTGKDCQPDPAGDCMCACETCVKADVEAARPQIEAWFKSQEDPDGPQG